MAILPGDIEFAGVSGDDINHVVTGGMLTPISSAKQHLVNASSGSLALGSSHGSSQKPTEIVVPSNFYADSALTDKIADTIQKANENANSNTAKSMEEAKLNREWQEQQNAKAMAFNRIEAEKNRNWQEMMSNTAHQREIADLKAAGLNPVLSAMNGNGASVTSGATASGVTSSGSTGQVDTSANSALVNLISAVYNRTMDLELAHVNAKYNAQLHDANALLEKELRKLINQHDSDMIDKQYDKDLDKDMLHTDGPYDLIGDAIKFLLR